MKPQYQLQRRIYSHFKVNDSNEQEGSNDIIQKISTTCFVIIASFWISMMIPLQVTAKELTSKDLTATYERNANLFVGGYTVKGTKLSIIPNINKVKTSPGGGGIESFRVAQECICSAEATEHGIFARGANPENAFLFLATLNENNEWTAEQTSVGTKPPYKATMRFGKTAGGPHTAVGSTLNSSGETVAFSAEQSAMGCKEGQGAAACEAVCGKHGLSWEMIRQRCGL